MEIKVEDGIVQLSAKNTPEELVQALRAVADKLTDLTGSKASDTKEPILYGSGKFDVRMAGGLVQVGISTEAGWVVMPFDAAGACSLIASVAQLLREAAITLSAQAEIAATKPTVQ